MRSPSNLERALAELSATNRVHYVDTQTGRTYSVTIEEHAALLPVLPDSVRVRMTEESAEATAAVVRARLATDN